MESDTEEEPVEKMTRLQMMQFLYRKSRLPRSALPSVDAFKHDAELHRHALLHPVYTYKPVLHCPSCEGVFFMGGHRGQNFERVHFEDGTADALIK